MKKFLRKGVFVSFGFTMVSMALVCVPISVDCGDGAEAAGWVCGETTSDMIINAMLIAEDVCGD